MRKTGIIVVLCLLTLVWFGAAYAAPTLEAAAKQKASIGEWSAIPVYGQGAHITRWHNSNELDEVLFEDSFDYADIDAMVTAGWTLEDGGSSTDTWFITSDARNSNHELDEGTPPYIFADSDDAGTGVTMDESLISPVINADGYSTLLISVAYYVNTGGGDYTNSASIDVTTDGGTNWTTVDSWLADNGAFSEYPAEFDISSVEGDLTQLQVRFRFWDDGSYGYYAGFDELVVSGGNGDLVAPSVDVNGVGLVLAGNDVVVSATITDNVGVDAATLTYGYWDGESISDETSVAMTAGDDDVFTGTIPAAFNTIGSTVVYAVTGADAAGNSTRDPEVGNYYGYKVFSGNVSFTDDFETDTGMWTTVQTVGDPAWERGEPTAGPESGYESTNVYATVLDGDYAFTQIDNLVFTESMIVEAGAAVSYMAWWEYESDYDGFRLEASTDGGETWDIVSASPAYNSGHASYGAFFSGATNQWYSIVHDLSEYEGETVQLRIWHRSDVSGAYYGVAIDDIQFVGFAMPATITGTVTADESGDPLVGANVVITDDGDVEVATLTTDDLGQYSVSVPAGTYSVSANSPGRAPVTVGPYTLAAGDEQVADIALEVSSTNYDVTGVVYSADTPDTPVAGASVTILGLTGFSTMANANGEFSFTDVPEGVFDIYLTHNPNGSNGYHDVTNTSVTINAENTDIDLMMPEVMVPSNVLVSSGSGMARMTWEAPANHAEEVAIRSGIEYRRAAVRQLASVGDPASLAKMQTLSNELQVLENRLQLAQNANGLDELGDFEGYRVFIDGEMVDELIEDLSYTFTELDNGRLYEFQVAADYGYDVTYLVASDAVTARPQSAHPYAYETTDYNWVDIRPSEGGSGTLRLDSGASTGDDVNSGLFEMGGFSFSLFGVMYESMSVCSNSWLSFTSTNTAHTFTIPNTALPNAMISACQYDLDVEANNDEYGIWTWYDDTNNLFYVQWHANYYVNPPVETYDFQVVLNGADNSMVFNYNSTTAAHGWMDTEEITRLHFIGIEDEAGTSAFVVDDFSITNGSAVRVYIDEVEFGNIEGVVTDAATTSPIANANVVAVSAGGVEYTAVSNADGEYALLELDQGDAPYDLTVNAGGYLEATVEDVDWLESEDYIHVENVEMTSIDPTTPPTILDPNGNFDNGINVYLAEPGALDWEGTLSYDDGTVVNAVGWNPGFTADYWYATKFSVAGRGVTLEGSSLRFLIYSDLDRWWPEGDETHQPVVIGVFNDNGEGMPGELVWTSDEVTISEEEAWADVDMSLNVTSTFFVGYYNVTPAAGQEPLCIDDENDYSVLYSSVDGGETWNLSSYGDALIRAAVTYYPTGEEAPTTATIAPASDKGNNYSALASMSAPVYGMSKKVLAPHHANFFSSLNELDELVGFNVEYSTNGTDWTAANAELIEGHDYFIELGTENEGTEYSIRAFAVVTNPEGGDDIVSDPSTVVTATYGMAPMAPTEFAGSADEGTVSFTWTAPTLNADGTELVDLAGYNVYMLTDDGADLLGSSETTSYSTTLEDEGFYSFVVTAVDEVPNESSASTAVSLMIGLDGFSTTFEDGMWNDLEGDAPWALGTPATEDISGALSGVNAWATNLTGDYGTSDNAMLATTEPLAVNHADAVLFYYHWIEYEYYSSTDNAYDGYNVSVSTDNGETWQVINPVGGYPHASIVGLGENVPGFTGVSDGWQLVTFELGDYFGQAILIGFRHGTDTSVQMFGAAIDDLSMYGVAEPTYGTIEGTVRECSDTGMGIEDADVLVNGIVLGQTAPNGNFSVEVITGTHTVSFEHPDYIPTSVSDVVVTEDNTTDMGDVVMLTPAATVSATTLEINYPIEDGDPVSNTFVLTNSGCGPMVYNAAINILNAANEIVASYPYVSGPQMIREPVSRSTRGENLELRRGPVADEIDQYLDNLESWDVSTATGDGQLVGAAIIGDRLYVNNWGSPSTIWELDFDGNLIETYTPSTGGAAFWNEMAYDPINGKLMTIADDEVLYRFDPDGTNIESMGTVGVDAWGIAYDYDNQKVYWGDPMNDDAWGVYDIATNQSTTLTTPTMGTPYALAYVPNDPDGNTIWGGFRFDDLTSYIYGYNPSTQTWSDTGRLYYDNYDANSGIAGIEVTDGYSDRLDIVTFAELTNDQVDVWEGMPLQTWLTIDPTSGDVAAGGDVTFTVTVDPSADPAFTPVGGQTVTAEVVINGNYFDDATVTVEIMFTSSVGENDLLPAKYALHQNYPNPFNPSTAIKFDLVASQKVKLTVYNMLGQEVARLVDGQMQAGFHNVTFDASRLASGVYFYRLETPAFTKMKKMVLVK